ncbi:MAG TPA: hypothetical protein VM598_13765 [Bdellovibrionota bacterium]|nr:hypothetical protein [Bdellovibrionota bacterium]
MKLFNRSKKLIGAAALVALALQGSAMAGQQEKKQSDKDREAQERRVMGFSEGPRRPAPSPDAPATTRRNFPGYALQINEQGSGVYRGFIITKKSLQKNGTKETEVHLLVRGILGRDDSYLGILMYPRKDREAIALYRIDPLENYGAYDMTRLSLTGDGFIGVESANVDPELRLTVRGRDLRINPASEHIRNRKAGPHRAGFLGFFESMEFPDPVPLFKGTPDVEWRDLVPGEYRGLYFSQETDAIDGVSINQWYPYENPCSDSEPCWETTAEFTFPSWKTGGNKAYGSRKVFARYPGMFTFNLLSNDRRGTHIEYADRVGVFLKRNGEEKLFLVNPFDDTDVTVVKKRGN